MPKFNWFICVSRYNTMMNTDYKNSSELLRALYKETKSVAKMEILLDCNHVVIREEMDRLKIPRRKNPRYNYKEKKLLSIPKEKLKELYIEEVIKICNCSSTFINLMCKKHDLIIKRRPIGQGRK